MESSLTTTPRRSVISLIWFRLPYFVFLCKIDSVKNPLLPFGMTKNLSSVAFSFPPCVKALLKTSYILYEGTELSWFIRKTSISLGVVEILHGDYFWCFLYLLYFLLLFLNLSKSFSLFSLLFVWRIPFNAHNFSIHKQLECAKLF